MIEIDFGCGGQDSKNFVFELASYYLKYACRLGFETEILSENDGSTVLWVKGQDAKHHFKNEGGQHVVQRVPVTEQGGRRQTSIVTVAILPLLPSIQELNQNEFEWIAQRKGGHGGQNVNKVSSAIRMSHKPTGLSVFINGRDQDRNRKRAIQVLTNKIRALQKDKIYAAYNEQRALQHDGGRRGRKDRTYSFIRGEVTDHRTGKRVPVWEIKKGRFDLLK